VDKGKILDWVEYAGTVITWLSGVVRTFPVKGENKGRKEPKPEAD